LAGGLGIPNSPAAMAENLANSTASSARQCGLGIPNLPAAMRRIWQVALQARLRSVDRTPSPTGVSQKREYFKYQPETIDDFALRLSELGVQRRSENLQKSAIGGHFSDL
jgi:hypothetical protein